MTSTPPVLWSDPNNPDRPPAAPYPEDDEFNGSVLSGKWSVYNPDSLALAPIIGGGLCSVDPLYTIQKRIYAIMQPCPTPPWRFRTKLIFDSSQGSYVAGGLFVRYSTGDKNLSFQMLDYSAAGQRYTAHLMRCNGATFSNEAFFYYFMNAIAYLELAFDGATFTWGISTSGISSSPFRRAATEALATFMGTAPNFIGLAVMPYSGSTGNANWGARVAFEWFRRRPY